MYETTSIYEYSVIKMMLYCVISYYTICWNINHQNKYSVSKIVTHLREKHEHFQSFEAITYMAGSPRHVS